MEEVSLQLVRNVLQEYHALTVAQRKHWPHTRTFASKLSRTAQRSTRTTTTHKTSAIPVHRNHPHGLWISCSALLLSINNIMSLAVNRFAVGNALNISTATAGPLNQLRPLFGSSPNLSLPVHFHSNNSTSFSSFSVLPLYSTKIMKTRHHTTLNDNKSNKQESLLRLNTSINESSLFISFPKEFT